MENPVAKTVEMMIGRFRLAVEEQGLWKLLWDEGQCSERDENAIQLVFKTVLAPFCEANNISLDAEVNFGRGPVDFKFSNGYQNRVEIKKMDNSRFWRGLSEQLPSYMRSDRVNDGWFLAVLFKDSESTRRKILEFENRVCEASRQTGLNLNFEVIDARPKQSASKL